jgi:poly(ribitol-phosphate) beta-N-acetylglucosaminyltransferase
MGIKVSVVIPVYNAGRYIDACIESLLNQSMDVADYEIIFVDDGSTDGSGETVAAAAADSDNAHVVHITNTGGPGGPRNLGMDLARGEYIYFLDDDDWLEPQALERMCAMADRNDSDIVIGRLVGHDRFVPKWLFRESRDRADILRHHLLGLLTPHKLFRSSFLRDHQIRFPEGAVRLEDHHFCVTAYFKAKVISVLADYSCCHWIKRDDGQNHSMARFDPVRYFAALSEVLDIVDEHVDPGELRDRYYAHWYRGKMLKRLGGGAFLAFPADYRKELFTAIRELTLDRFDEDVERWIPQHMRPRAALLRAGAYDDLVRLARAERGIMIRPTLEDLRWEGESLVIGVTADFTYAGGEPVTFRRNATGRMSWELPASLTTPIPAAALDVTESLPKSRLDVLARHRGTGVEFFLPIDFDQVPADGDEMGLTLTGQARLHAPTARAGGPLDPGAWDLTVRMGVCGWGVESRVGADRTGRAGQSCVAGFAGADARLVVPYWAEKGNLSVRVAPESLPHIVAAAAPAARLTTSTRKLWLEIPLPYVPREPISLTLRRRGPLAGEFVIPAGFAPADPSRTAQAPARPGDPHGRLVAVIPTGRRHVGRGVWTMELRCDERTAKLGALLDVAGRGDVRLRPADESTHPAVRLTTLRKLARRVPGLRACLRALRPHRDLTPQEAAF